MKYFVTYLAMDSETGSNPLWHASLLFSQWNDLTGGKVEVIDQYGFYAVPATYTDTSWKGWLKKIAGVNVDSQGNHGWLKHEEYRYLDMGCGLHGVSYELREEMFLSFRDQCKSRIENQEKAIKDIVSANRLDEKQGKWQMYSHEQHSSLIFAIEKAQSLAQKRSPRLAPFDLDLTWELTGPSLVTSHTCKSHLIDLLRDVVGEEKIARLTEHGKHPTVPRYSGKMERFHLHSEGPLTAHTKRNGDTVYFRDGSLPEVKLYWTLPPQEIEALSEETKLQFLIDPMYEESIKGVVKKLQKLEWYFINLAFPKQIETYRDSLLEQIKYHYDKFSSISAEISDKKANKTASFGSYLVNSLFSPPKNESDRTLKYQLMESDRFLNMIYSAIADGYSLALDPQEEDDVVAVISYLPDAAKEKICAILERDFIKTHSDWIDTTHQEIPNMAHQ